MKVLVFVVFCLTAAAAYEVIQDEEGEEYYVVPLVRQRRQTKWGINNNGAGIAHTGTVFQNNNHRLDATGSAFKNFKSPGLRPDQIGGRLDYLNKPTRSTAFISADNTRNWGTDVNAGVKYNIHQNKNWNVDVTGQYGRHYGGPYGTGKPQSGVFLNVNGRF